MGRSSNDLYVQSANETRGQVQNTNGTSVGGVRTREGFRTQGGVRTRAGGLQTRGEVQIIERFERHRNRVLRCRRSTNGTQNAFGSISIEDDDFSDNTYIPCEEEEAEEEGRRGQVRGRGQGLVRGRGCGHRCGRGHGHGIGHGRGRRHEEEEEEVITMVTSRPGIGNSRARNSNGKRHREEEEEPTTVTLRPRNGASCGMNSSGRVGVDNSNERRHREEEKEATTMVTVRPGNGASCDIHSSGRPGVDNSCATNSVERHEIGNSHATNCNGVCSSPSRPQIDEEPQIEEEGAESGDILILDNTNILKCPVCFKTFSIDIYQCKKGHRACSSCYRELNKCPRCSTGYSRDHHLEEVHNAFKITCLNSKYGCGEKFSYRMKGDLFEHARSCAYEPCYCPLPGCGFDGSYKDLYLHFAGKHPASATRFKFGSSFPVDIGADIKYKFFQEDDHTLFILLCDVTTIGNVVEVICMGPSSLQNEYSYDLEARSACTSIKVTSLTHSLPKWTVDLPQKPVLVVTKDLNESSRDHKIHVCIHRKGKN